MKYLIASLWLMMLTASAGRAGAEVSYFSFIVGVSPSQGGAVYGDFISCHDAGSCAYTLLEGTQVELEAAPLDGWKFVSWTGCDDTSGVSCSVTVDGDRNVSASFQELSVEEYSPKIEVTPAAIDFGAVKAGETSTVEVVTVSSVGEVDLYINNVYFSGVGSNMFLISGDTCAGQSLPPGESCEVSVQLAPDGEATLEVKLRISSDDPGSPQTDVSLTGSGLSAAELNEASLSISPGELDFGVVETAGQSPEQTVTVTNTDDVVVTMQAASVDEGDYDEFLILSDGCADVALAPGAACQIVVAFAPMTDGEKEAYLYTGASATEEYKSTSLSVKMSGATGGGGGGCSAGGGGDTIPVFLIWLLLLGLSGLAHRRRASQHGMM